MTALAKYGVSKNTHFVIFGPLFNEKGALGYPWEGVKLTGITRPATTSTEFGTGIRGQDGYRRLGRNAGDRPDGSGNIVGYDHDLIAALGETKRVQEADPNLTTWIGSFNRVTQKLEVFEGVRLGDLSESGDRGVPMGDTGSKSETQIEVTNPFTYERYVEYDSPTATQLPLYQTPNGNYTDADLIGAVDGTNVDFVLPDFPLTGDSFPIVVKNGAGTVLTEDTDYTLVGDITYAGNCGNDQNIPATVIRFAVAPECDSGQPTATFKSPAYLIYGREALAVWFGKAEGSKFTAYALFEGPSLGEDACGDPLASSHIVATLDVTMSASGNGERTLSATFREASVISGATSPVSGGVLRGAAGETQILLGASGIYENGAAQQSSAPSGATYVDLAIDPVEKGVYALYNVNGVVERAISGYTRTSADRGTISQQNAIAAYDGMVMTGGEDGQGLVRTKGANDFSAYTIGITAGDIVQVAITDQMLYALAVNDSDEVRLYGSSENGCYGSWSEVNNFGVVSESCKPYLQLIAVSANDMRVNIGGEVYRNHNLGYSTTVGGWVKIDDQCDYCNGKFAISPDNPNVNLIVRSPDDAVTLLASLDDISVGQSYPNVC